MTTWTDIVQVSAGLYHTVGLKADGTAVAVGYNSDGQCNVTAWTDIVQVSPGAYHTVGLKSDGTVVAVGSNGEGQCNVTAWTDIVQVSAGGLFTIGLKSDGTAVALGYNAHGQCNVTTWTDIVQVSAGLYHTVGLKSDGTAVAVGWNNPGQCNVSGWHLGSVVCTMAVSPGGAGTTTPPEGANYLASGTAQIAVGNYHTVRLKGDGTAAAVGLNTYGQCNVGSWMDITQVAAGGMHTVGLESDGTAVAVGSNADGQLNVSGWSNLTQVAIGSSHTLGLKADGTAVAVGRNTYGELGVTGWSGIVQVAGGTFHSVGLKSNGTVVAVGYGSASITGWSGIKQIATGYYHTVGLKADGTVVAVGDNQWGQCNVSAWTGIIRIAAGTHHTLGLQSDGTVVAVGFNDYGACDLSGWADITQLDGGNAHSVGLKGDGTVVALGYNSSGQCNVSSWNSVVVAISASPAADYRFDHWTVSGGATLGSDPYQNANSVTLTGDGTVTANFIELVTLTMAIDPEGGRTTVPAVGDHIYDINTTVDISASPFAFESWAVTGGGTLGSAADVNPNTVTLAADATVTALYRNDNVIRCSGTVTINGSPAPAGTIIDVYDPDGTLCGQSEVITEGEYVAWIMLDYSNTPALDEGAEYGDLLDFRIASYIVIALMPDGSPPICAAGLGEMTVNIQAGEVQDSEAHVTRMTARLDSRREDNDKLNIQSAQWPTMPNSDPAADFNPATSQVQLCVGGIALPIMSGFEESGARLIYRSPRGEIPRVRMVIDMAAGTWSFKASKADLRGMNYSKGLAVILIIDGEMVFADVVDVDMAVTWQYNPRRDGPGEAILTGLAGFDVVGLRGRYSTMQEDRDQVKVKGMIGEVSFEPVNDDIMLWVDSVLVVDIPAASLGWNVRRNRFNYRNPDRLDMRLVSFDLNRGRWSGRNSRIALGDFTGNINPGNGILITLQIGKNASSILTDGCVKVLLRYRE